MARVRDRDPAAFESLYDGFHRLVYAIAQRMLGDPMAAEDLTQAVFLKLWANPGAFQGGNFSAWIARVARNRALDVIRARGARPEGEFPEDLGSDDDLDDAVFAKIDGERVRAALAELPEEQRQPIELGFFAGVTHEEIARSTGTPLGTVKTRIRSGLRKLREALETSVA
jgi:RNA polymerase sigma-70 factor (ECF subfamily)